MSKGSRVGDIQSVISNILEFSDSRRGSEDITFFSGEEEAFWEIGWCGNTGYAIYQYERDEDGEWVVDVETGDRIIENILYRGASLETLIELIIENKIPSRMTLGHFLYISEKIRLSIGIVWRFEFFNGRIVEFDNIEDAHACNVESGKRISEMIEAGGSFEDSRVAQYTLKLALYNDLGCSRRPETLVKSKEALIEQSKPVVKEKKPMQPFIL